MKLIGIDAGGSTCRARLAREDGTIMGEGKAGQSNLRIGNEGVLSAVKAACDAAFLDAGLLPETIAQCTVGIGMAGLERAAGDMPFTHTELGARAVTFATDAEIANLGAHGGQDGGTVIVGTGSIGILKIGKERIRIGGHGFPISDQGSGAFLGFRAIRATLEAMDGLLSRSAFTDEMFQSFSNERSEIIRWLDGATPTEFAKLAPKVLNFARQGDPHAEQIVDDAARYISYMLQVLEDRGANRLCLYGGLGSILAPHVKHYFEGIINEPVGDSLQGALQLATQLALDTSTA
jgi:glucosamine kinase